MHHRARVADVLEHPQARLQRLAVGDGRPRISRSVGSSACSLAAMSDMVDHLAWRIGAVFGEG